MNMTAFDKFCENNELSKNEIDDFKEYLVDLDVSWDKLQEEDVENYWDEYINF